MCYLLWKLPLLQEGVQEGRGLHFYTPVLTQSQSVTLITCCSSVLILCHCQHKSTVILFLVWGGVRNECPFTFKISLYGIWFFPALRGSIILTTAVLNSRVKRKPDKEMSVLIQFNKAPYLFLQKKKKPQKILSKRKCPSFNTVKIFQCCQSDFKASPHLSAPAKALMSVLRLSWCTLLW